MHKTLDNISRGGASAPPTLPMPGGTHVAVIYHYTAKTSLSSSRRVILSSFQLSRLTGLA